MPIPALQENNGAIEQGLDQALGLPMHGGKVLQFPVRGRTGAVVGVSDGAVEETRQVLKDRALAHVVDAIFINGFSLYAAKVLAFVMALGLVGEVQAGGADRASQTFQSLVAFGTFRAWMVCLVFFSCIYVTLSTHYFGRTLGKALFRLKVVGAGGERPDMRQSFRRYLGYSLTYASGGLLFLLGYMNSESQTVHDRLSETDVVRIEI